MPGKGRGYNPGQQSLFPGLVDRPHCIGSFGPMDPAFKAAEAERRAWWRAWDAAHPPDRTCIGCGLPGGALWLTIGAEGPRPCHRECFPRR